MDFMMNVLENTDQLQSGDTARKSLTFLVSLQLLMIE